MTGAAGCSCDYNGGAPHDTRVAAERVHSRRSPTLRGAPLAQLAEQRTLNPQVGGSSPPGRTTAPILWGSSVTLGVPVTERCRRHGRARIPRRTTSMMGRGTTLVTMRVEFYKSDVHGRPQSAWEATRGKRTRVPGTVMAAGKGIPHDLAQYVIEAATGYPHGFWDLVAKGATFKSTGRRTTKPGRAVIAEHRSELAGAEKLAGRHLGLWRAGEDSPVSAALSRAFEQWSELSGHERLTFDWPSPIGVVVERRGPT
jgi:hypothetical protein